MASDPKPHTEATRGRIGTIALQASAVALGAGIVFGVGYWQYDGEYPVEPAPPEKPSAYADYLAEHNLLPPPENLAYYSTYTDGQFTATADYKAAGTSNKITVTVDLAGGAVRSIDVEDESDDRTSQRYQESFQEVLEPEVVGRSLNDIDVRSLAGATLTAKGFRQAVNAIRDQAKTADASVVEF